MPLIREILNPFEPSNSMACKSVAEGSTPLDYVHAKFGSGGDFPHPTVLIHQGKEVMRSQWGEIKLAPDDVTIFKRLPQGDPFTAIFSWLASNWFAVAATGYSLYAASTVDAPEFKDRDEAPSVWNLSGQRNANKLGQPIECPYGKQRLFPSYAAKSYTNFENNEQILFQLFCIGQGYYDLETPKFEDTAITSFQDTTYEVYEPGDAVTLFPDNIVTSVEVAAVELFGTNESEYAGETGPFVANAANTDADKLEWDVVFPYGLYMAETDGTLSALTVEIDFSYREIDDAGSPLSGYTTVAFSKTLSTDTPQRFTVSTTVSAGRYEVKAVRTNAANTSTRARDNAQWFQLRAQLPSTKNYGNVTLVAVKSRATNNLNDNTRNRFNVVGTRKLEIWNGSVWSSPTATRSPVWAYCDVLRSAYGGNLADSKLDLAGLLTLAATYSTRGDNFDFTFDRKTTIHAALKTIATAGRARSIVVGNQFTLVRDAAQTAPVAAFAPENIHPGSFNLSIRLQPESDYDGIQIAYVDEDTWLEETVDCLYGNDAGTNLRKVTLAGVTDRDKAYQMGLYMRAKEVLQREACTLQTGPEGRVPIFGDLVAVGHDSPKWGKSGFVAYIEGDNVTVNLTEPLGSAKGDRIAFRDKTGAIEGPYACTVTDEFTVVSDTTITGNFLFNDYDDPPIYYFGTASALYRKMILTEKTSDMSEDNETLSFVNYDERIYQFDNYTATPIVDAPIPDAAPDLPAVTNLTLTDVVDSPTEALAAWNAVAGAVYYVIQISYDNTVWSQPATSFVNYYAVDVSQGQVYVRVAAVGAGQGPWATANSVIGFDQRVTSGGDIRVTSGGDTRVSTQ